MVFVLVPIKYVRKNLDVRMRALHGEAANKTESIA